MIKIVIGNLLRYIIITTVALFGAGNVSAREDEILELVLTKAFMIQNITIYCSQFTPKAIEKSSGQYGDISQLTYHIRQEVIAGLPADQSAFVVRRSADRARAGALRAIRRFYELDRDREQARIVEWCEQSAALEIAEYVRGHDGRHDEFVATISAAKNADERSNPELKP